MTAIPAYYYPSWPLLVSPALWFALALVIAVLTGEVLARQIRLPRIVSYTGTGLLLGHAGFDLIMELPAREWRLVVDLALGVLLFELGSKVNLRWLRANMWITATSLLEALLTFFAIFSLMIWFETKPAIAAVTASIAIITSPAIIMRTTAEYRTRGQVTDRLLLMTAMNCMYAIICHKLALAFMYEATGFNLVHTILQPVYLIGGSVLFGWLFGLVFDFIHLHLGQHEETFSFILFGMIATATILASAMKLSPVLVLLGAGLIMRYRRRHPRNFPPHFGSAGAVLVILMFIANGLAANLDGFGINLSLIALFILVRAAAKLLPLLLLSGFSGLSLYQAGALGIALNPMSGVALLMTLDTAALFPAFGAGPGLMLMSSIVILELAGPILVQNALRKAGETSGKPL